MFRRARTIALIFTLTLYRLKHAARLLRCPNEFFFNFFCSQAILLGTHLADLLSADRRWRDGIKTGLESSIEKGDGRRQLAAICTVR